MQYNSSMQQHAIGQVCNNVQGKHATTCENGLKLIWTALNHAQISGQSAKKRGTKAYTNMHANWPIT